MKLALTLVATMSFPLILMLFFILGKLTVDQDKIFNSGYQSGYDKGYVQGRLETEEGMRAAISACVNEDVNSMLDCLDKI